MTVTATSVWKNCLAFIQDNIQPQAYKTWFEPIKPVRLSEKSLSIQVPSKFFYEWLEEHYIKLLKVALTRELGEGAKLVYVIKMENTYGNREPFTEKIPSANRGQLTPQEMDVPIKSKNPELKNPFVMDALETSLIVAFVSATLASVVTHERTARPSTSSWGTRSWPSGAPPGTSPITP